MWEAPAATSTGTKFAGVGVGLVDGPPSDAACLFRVIVTPDDEVGGQGVDRRGGRVDLQVLRDGRV